MLKRLKLCWRFIIRNNFDYGYGLELLEDKWERLYLHLTSKDTVGVHSLSDLKALGRVVKLLKRQRRGYWSLANFKECLEREEEEWKEIWELVSKHGRNWWD